MMRKLVFTACSVLLGSSLLGCATPNSNPSQGGFFDGIHGLSSGAYQQRIDQKEDQLADTRSAGAELRADNRDLGRQADTLDAQEAAYRQKLAQLRQDVGGLETRLKNAKMQGQSKLNQKRSLMQKLTRLKTQIQAIEQQRNPKPGQSDADLQRLRSEKEKLQEEIIKLTSK